MRRTKRLRGKAVESQRSKCSKSRSSNCPKLTPVVPRRNGRASSRKPSCAEAVKEDLGIASWNMHQSAAVPGSQITQPRWSRAPPGPCRRQLLKRQSRRELERAVLELRRNGFSDDQKSRRTRTNCGRTAPPRARRERSRSTSSWSGSPKSAGVRGRTFEDYNERDQVAGSTRAARAFAGSGRGWKRVG